MFINFVVKNEDHIGVTYKVHGTAVVCAQVVVTSEHHILLIKLPPPPLFFSGPFEEGLLEGANLRGGYLVNHKLRKSLSKFPAKLLISCI